MRKAVVKYLVTGAIVTVAAVAFGLKYRDYVTNPWTRDGQVMATVIQITPRVSGPIISLPIVDNQFVKAGDTLFQIDPQNPARKVSHVAHRRQHPVSLTQNAFYRFRLGWRLHNNQPRAHVFNDTGNREIGKRRLDRSR